MTAKTSILAAVLLAVPAATFGDTQQWVEGFDHVQFHYNANKTAASRDFRGTTPGYMTAGWWAPGQMKSNILSWETAVVPQKEPTTFSFIAATSVLPSEFSRGPSVRLTVNDKYALTFTLGVNRDFTWRSGSYTLKYLSKRVEFPYFGSQRQFELNGNSGVFQLSVPASAVEAGKASLLQVEILPFARWSNGWFMVKEYRDTMSQTTNILAGEVETLQQDMARIKEETQILATKAYPELTSGPEIRNEVIYQDGFRHVHPADLIRLRNGDLLLMAREGTEHIAADGDVFMLRSHDDGQTWGEKTWIGSIPNLDEREGCGIQLHDGTVLVGIFYNGLYDADGIYGGRPQMEGKLTLGTYTIVSEDNGHTWSKPRFIDTTNMPFRSIEGPTDAPIELPDHSVIMGVIAYGLNGDSKDKAAVMLRSTDKGRTWAYLSTIADDPGGKLGGFLEPGIVRTKTGRIVAALRNHGPDNAIWVAYSDDNGKTWSPPKETAMIGHPADLIQLSDGRLMATYGIRTVHAIPAGIRACFSRDNGETWDIASEVQIRNDFINWDVGYPESLELADGMVFTVYYYNLFGKYYLGGSYWKP